MKGKSAKSSGLPAVAALAMKATLLLFLAACAGNKEGVRQPEAEPMVDEKEWLEQLEAWHAERMKKLRRKDGWLCLAGLYWLKQGDNRLGSAEASDVRLPEGACADAGILQVGDDIEHVLFRPAAGVEARVSGKTVREPVSLKTDAAGEPDKVEFGSWAFIVIIRGGKPALRLFDRTCPLREKLETIERFPPDPRYRVIGRWVAFERPKELQVRSVVGTTEKVTISGRVEFELDGRRLSLVPMGDEEEGKLFFVFADRTNGRETYGGGRFLVAEKHGDRVVLDFNRAYNPPCSFTPWATCPVPRPENRLPVEIRAGEKAVHLYHH